MAWTYSGDPAASERDALRFLVGDTTESDPLLQDAELDYLLARKAAGEFATLREAAAAACETIAAKLARQVDKAVGNLSLQLSQKRGHFEAQAKSLRLQAEAELARGAAPYAGGISRADKEAEEAREDRVPPAFAVDEAEGRCDPLREFYP